MGRPFFDWAPLFFVIPLFRYLVIPIMAAFFVIPLFRLGRRPAICPYSATMVPNSLQGLVALYASSDSAGTWSVAEEMEV